MKRCEHTIRIFRWQLDSMDEYSTTLPTGTTPFKMWKARIRASQGRDSSGHFTRKPPRWVVGQYHPVDDPDKVGVRWFNVTYLQGPMPRGWRSPDWARQHAYNGPFMFPKHIGAGQ